MHSAAVIYGSVLGAREERGFERLLAQLKLLFIAALGA
jgi:hypothetical protein